MVKRGWLSGWYIIHLTHQQITLSGLLETLSGWALEYPRLFVLEDLSVHLSGKGPSVTLDSGTGILPVCFGSHTSGRPHTGSYFCHWIVGSLITVNAVPLSDHFALKVWLNIHILLLTNAKNWIGAKSMLLIVLVLWTLLLLFIYLKVFHDDWRGNLNQNQYNWGKEESSATVANL